MLHIFSPLMSTLKPVLESLGLNPKEIELYLMLLQIGTAPASALARRMRIPSSTAQYTCQQLQKKGLIRMIQKGNTYLFNCEPPRNLLMLVKREQDLLVTKQESVERIVGELEGMMNPQSVLPKVKFFEGREGILEAYREVLQDLEEGGEVLSYVQPIDLEKDTLGVAPLFEKVSEEFNAKKIRTRIITTMDTSTAARYQEEDKFLEEHRFIPQDSFECAPTEILLYKNKMYAMTADENVIFATILESRSIVSMQKTIFEITWKKIEEDHRKAVATLKR